ncbi:unnamed protein product [Ceratitis capitata]|uniref:(Mediterranean fruit fly) hypothetical protein n=1 Tax=Ceratitis capitata TaxID=7213 RepID=A0A811VE76_CERCA|nr:unnamed protein product [Ceratitis capitata]
MHCAESKHFQLQRPNDGGADLKSSVSYAHARTCGAVAWYVLLNVNIKRVFDMSLRLRLPVLGHSKKTRRLEGFTDPPSTSSISRLLRGNDRTSEDGRKDYSIHGILGGKSQRAAVRVWNSVVNQL